MGDMEGGFGWTIPLIQIVFAALFLAVYRAGATIEARTWGIAYCLNAGAFVASLGTAVVPEGIATIAADALFAGAIFCFSEALIQRYALPRLIGIRLAILFSAIALPLAGTITGSVAFEVVTCDLGYSLQIMIPLVSMRRRGRHAIDHMIVCLSWAVVVANLGRTASPVNTVDDAGLASFLASTYSYLMFADGMITGVAFGGVALAAVTTELLERYKRQANVDPMTGLLNRRGLELAAEPSRRAGRECLLVCDLDHFKRVNDSYGHAMGDQVLTTFGRIVQAVAPTGSVAARTGGEEFVVFLPDHSRIRGETVAISLQQMLMAHDWSAIGLGWRQTASIGLVTQPGGMSLTEMLEAADEQLYNAKRGGRDRICSSPLPTLASA